MDKPTTERCRPFAKRHVRNPWNCSGCPLALSRCISRCGLTYIELTWSSARCIRGRSFWSREPQRQARGTFSMMHDAGGRVARRWPVSPSRIVREHSWWPRSPHRFDGAPHLPAFGRCGSRLVAHGGRPINKNPEVAPPLSRPGLARQVGKSPRPRRTNLNFPTTDYRPPTTCSACGIRNSSTPQTILEAGTPDYRPRTDS